MAARDVHITGLEAGRAKDLDITVGGNPISPNGLLGFTLQADGDGVPTLTLDVAVIDKSTVSGEMDVVIPDGTRDTLVKLGWTPPGGS